MNAASQWLPVQEINVSQRKARGRSHEGRSYERRNGQPHRMRVVLQSSPGAGKRTREQGNNKKRHSTIRRWHQAYSGAGREISRYFAVEDRTVCLASKSKVYQVRKPGRVLPNPSSLFWVGVLVPRGAPIHQFEASLFPHPGPAWDSWTWVISTSTERLRV